MAMTIGQLAAGAGVNIQAVRYYESRDLMPRLRAGARATVNTHRKPCIA